jgi:glutamine synthetase
MDEQQVNEIISRAKADNVKYITLQFTDIYGLSKSLTIGINHLKNSLMSGTWFDGSSISGFARIHESDMFLKPDPNTYAIIPWLKSNNGNTARFICDVHKPDGEPFEGDPRFILRKAMAEAEATGYEFKTGPELEFFMFKKDNGKISPLPHDKGGYFDLSMDEAYEVRRDMVEALEEFGINVEASHHEVAEGSHEIDFKYGNALTTADNATTFKFTVKAIAQKHNLHVTFMPKPISKINGSGMHVHQSLFDINTGKNIFYDETDPYNLSQTARYFIGGQLLHSMEMSAILSPLVNSYKRLVPGYEAATYICWAHTNRSALIRIPRIFKGKEQAARVEYRAPDPCSNTYLAFAVLLKAGLDGIKNKIEPPEAVEEDVYHFDGKKLLERGISVLPHSLWQAVKELKKSTLMQQALGTHTFQKYIEAKTAEWDDFRIHVTDWEQDRYLELY